MQGDEQGRRAMQCHALPGWVVPVASPRLGRLTARGTLGGRPEQGQRYPRVPATGGRARSADARRGAVRGADRSARRPPRTRCGERGGESGARDRDAPGGRHDRGPDRRAGEGTDRVRGVGKRLEALEDRPQRAGIEPTPEERAENAAASLLCSISHFAPKIASIHYRRRLDEAQEAYRRHTATPEEARKAYAVYESVKRACVRDELHALLDALDASDDPVKLLRAWADESVAREPTWFGSGYAALYRRIEADRAFNERGRFPIWGLWRHVDPERTENDLRSWQRVCRSMVDALPDPT